MIQMIGGVYGHPRGGRSTSIKRMGMLRWKVRNRTIFVGVEPFGGNRMIEEHEFKKHAHEALTALQGDLVLAGDDYGFESSLHGGAITISFERPPGKFTIVPDAGAGQIKVTLGRARL